MLQIMTNPDDSLWLPRWRHIFPSEVRVSIMPDGVTRRNLLIYLQHPGEEFDTRFAQPYEPRHDIRVYRHRTTKRPIKVIVKGPYAGNVDIGIKYWRSQSRSLSKVLFSATDAFLDTLEELLQRMATESTDSLHAVIRFDPRDYYELLFALQEQSTGHFGGHFDAFSEIIEWLKYWDERDFDSPVQKQLEFYRCGVDSLARGSEEQLVLNPEDTAAFVSEWSALAGLVSANVKGLQTMQPSRIAA